jgi:hypothetical protein
MSSKRDTINLLRQKVNAMQRNLEAMQQRTVKVAELPDILKPVNKITHRKKQRNLSQTHRELSLGVREEDRFFVKDVSPGCQERATIRMNT